MRGHRFACVAIAGMVALMSWTEHTGSWERDKSCVYASSSDVEARLAALTAALQTGDAEAAAANYSPDAILMDVGETAIHLGRTEIATFYSNQPRRPLIETVSRTLETSCGVASLTGSQRYRWGTNPADASIMVAYRMILGHGSDQWLIIHHHNELLAGTIPEAPATVAKPLGKPRLTTGSITPAPNDDITLPTPAIELPQSPPVFIPGVRPELLLAPLPRATAPTVPQTLPASSIQIPALPRALVAQPLPDALTARVTPPTTPTASPAAAPTSNPRPTLDLPQLPIAAALTPAQPSGPAHAAVGVDRAATTNATVVMPPLQIAIGAFPLQTPNAKDRPAQIAPQSMAPERAPEPPDQAAGRPLAALPSKSKQATAPVPAKAPQVASFAKRAEPPRPPAIAKPEIAKAEPKAKAGAKPAAVASAPKAPAIVPAAPAKAAYPAYRPGRWVYDAPVFGD
jgi:hypothetical protein